MICSYIVSSVIIIACLISLAVGAYGFSGSDNQAKRHPSRELFDSLEELSRIVDIAYCVGTTGVWEPFECLSYCKEFQRFELVTTWNTGPFLSDSCGYIALSHHPSAKRIIVAFRGTYSIANTIIDLSAYPQAYVPYNPGDNHQSVVPQCLNCTVHSGFLASWANTRATVLENVSAARQQYQDYDLILVGHSLGGAVAALAGVEMQLRGWEPQVTTFGEPKVGNKAFARFLDRVFGLDVARQGRMLDDQALKFRKVTHVNDPVPLLPLQEWGYEMHAGEIFISKVDLPPAIEDVELCQGDHDDRCIAGAEQTIDAMMDKVNVIVSQTQPPPKRGDSSLQAILAGSESPQDSTISDNKGRGKSETPPSVFWNPIPSRYRLWELFFAHRDYFWRLGLCVPGGDPTG
ncbi:lipase family protein [Aspergillus clavatus NRRL 1]|uniref:feruloyl esterase n=1 Tax=Aspergillus clavatus (strain ATCC 1007 / CBS 513.65 / DSM 816 / NCTC 3887 / NRRL 1 / QM 1276 / 107) TaxID=344612 RepID=A1CE41_ASPCL|nr:lipase, putative [Aspergillus clavatus NRRL 1]EAW11140.1 lipase, putative [Aspergillus clavatus NRRL 1]